MPAKDILHDNVKTALQRDGWIITHDPLSLTTEDGIDIAIDLAAERLIAAERSGEKIAIEVKSFISLSAYYEFHTALGQFLNYREVLDELEPERVLFLAIPDEVYQSLFQRKTIQKVLERYQVNLIVVDPEQEIVLLWQK